MLGAAGAACTAEKLVTGGPRAVSLTPPPSHLGWRPAFLRLTQGLTRFCQPSSRPSAPARPANHLRGAESDPGARHDPDGDRHWALGPVGPPRPTEGWTQRPQVRRGKANTAHTSATEPNLSAEPPTGPGRVLARRPAVRSQPVCGARGGLPGEAAPRGVQPQPGGVGTPLRAAAEWRGALHLPPGAHAQE